MTRFRLRLAELSNLLENVCGIAFLICALPCLGGELTRRKAILATAMALLFSLPVTLPCFVLQRIIDRVFCLDRLKRELKRY